MELERQLAEARASEQRMIEVAANRVAKAEFWKATTETANQTIAAQSAEIERLREAMKPLVDELDQVKDLREQDAYAHSQECGKYEVELAALRERLEAAEKKIEELENEAEEEDDRRWSDGFDRMGEDA
jgi:soluble cytochrome b562